jgi:hypothetical protein
LHIINNYTGDRMAFDMGRRLPRPGHRGRHGNRRRRHWHQRTPPTRQAPRHDLLLRDQGTGAASDRSDVCSRSLPSENASALSRGRWAWRSLLRRLPRRAHRCSSWATTRSRWASASRRARPSPRSDDHQQHHRRMPGGGHRPALRVGRRGRADDQRLGGTPISELTSCMGATNSYKRSVNVGALRGRVLHVARHGRSIGDLVKVVRRLKGCSRRRRDRGSRLLEQ